MKRKIQKKNFYKAVKILAVLGMVISLIQLYSTSFLAPQKAKAKAPLNLVASKVGENDDDKLGLALSAGDINGDGYDDLMASAYAYDDGANKDVGKVYIYFGGSSFDMTPDVTITGVTSSEVAGFPVGKAGDIDRDGKDDIVVGTIFWDSSRGKLNIFFGKNLTQGSNLLTTNADVTILGEGMANFFGFSIINGDYDGDDYSDISVSAPVVNKAYIFFGKNLKKLSSGDTIDLSSDSADVTINGDPLGGWFGSIGANTAGDFNNDGCDDVIIGDYEYDDGANTDAGKGYVFFGRQNWPTSLSAATDADVTMTGEGAGNKFGYILPSGDVNNDNYDDLIVGTDAAEKVYLFYGGKSISGNIPAGKADVIITGENDGDYFGFISSGIGDINKDGFSDLGICASYYDNGIDTNAGKCYLFLGQNWPSGTNLLAVDADYSVLGENAEDNLQIIMSGGDFNKDGWDEVVIGNQRYPGGINRGKIYVYSVSHLSPSVILNSLSPDPTTDNTPTFTGNAIDPDGGSIVSVEYSLNGGSSWKPASASDGSFNSSNENYTFTTEFLSGDNTYSVLVRAKDSENAQTAFSEYANDTFTIKKPYIVSAQTKTDTTIELIYSENLAGHTVSKNDFSIDIPDSSYYLISAVENLSGIVTLTLNKPFGKDLTPKIIYTKGSLVDLEGDYAPSQTIQASDGIPNAPEATDETATPPILNGELSIYRDAINFAIDDLMGDGTKEIVTVPKNGPAHVKIFSKGGHLLNPGFFAYDPKYTGGANIYISDLNGDGKREIITVPLNDSAHVRIFDSEGNSLLNPGFFAYPEAYKSGVNLAIEDMDNDGLKEIITVPSCGPAHVRIFDKGGNPTTGGFFAYDSRYTSGANLAVGDLNGDGTKEIITVPLNNSSFVKIFDKEGNLIVPGFYAYPKEYKGGANLALADLDNDGKKEIITVPASGPAHVRIFDHNGKPKTGGFFAYNSHYIQGTNLIVSDLNIDGFPEIITVPRWGSAHVRIFDRNGKPITGGFFAYPELFKVGGNILFADLFGSSDGDIIVAPGRKSNHIRIFSKDGQLLMPGFFAY